MSDETLTLAFTEIRRKFRRIVMRFFPDEEEAEDALQEAFCHLWPNRDKIATVNDATALVVATMRNLGIDAFRRRKGVTKVSLDERISDTLPDNDTDPAAEREMQYRLVRRIIESRLSEVQRTIVHMRELDGMPYCAIADKLGMQETAVRMQLSRARKTIRDCYFQLTEHEEKKH